MSHKVVALDIKPDINLPRYDQSTYIGRAKHFFSVANPLNIFVSESTLDKCKEVVVNYRLVYLFLSSLLYNNLEMG